MADSDIDVPLYSAMQGVETLRQIPNGQNADAVAIRIPNETTNTELTYSQLADLIDQLAQQLVPEIQGDDNKDDCHVAHVAAIAMPNNVEFVVSFLAVTWTRSVAAPLNPNYTESEYHFYMQDNQSKVLLVPATGNPAAEAAATQLGIPILVVHWTANHKETIRLETKCAPSSLSVNPEKKQKYTFAPQPSDVALFLHTSGTTAKPKGVPLRHSNLVASINNIATCYQLTHQDAVLLVMPLFHVHGLMSALLSTLATGGCVIVPNQVKFSAQKFWFNAVQGHATWVTCVPTMYQVLLLRYDTDYPKETPPNFRFVRSCSAALAPAVLQDVEVKFRAPCVEAYAMTEASHQMCSNPIHGPRKPGTVGKGTGVQVAILDVNNQVVKEPDTEGEVCIRGKNVTTGYLGVSDQVNQEAFAGGWFHTGDQGKLDKDGYLTLTGRIKELINRGGEKISPLEVDAAMLSHNAVAEAVSFAIPDEKYGEVVGAALVLKEGESLNKQELQQFLTDKLSSFKIPTKVFFDDKLPKTATGKIQRRIVASHFLSDK